MTFPFEKSICQNGQMNEGEISTLYGLEGIPSLSEEITLERDLKILEYTGGKLFIPTISTSKSVELIKNAKRKGLQIITSVSINNIFFNEKKLINFDTRFKILPPLRSEEDRLILVNALSEGIIEINTIGKETESQLFSTNFFAINGTNVAGPPISGGKIPTTISIFINLFFKVEFIFNYFFNHLI